MQFRSNLVLLLVILGALMIDCQFLSGDTGPNNTISEDGSNSTNNTNGSNSTNNTNSSNISISNNQNNDAQNQVCNCLPNQRAHEWQGDCSVACNDEWTCKALYKFCYWSENSFYQTIQNLLLCNGLGEYIPDYAICFCYDGQINDNCNQTFMNCPDNCTSYQNGLCNRKSGVCKCFEPYTGESCNETLSCENETQSNQTSNQTSNGTLGNQTSSNQTWNLTTNGTNISNQTWSGSNQTELNQTVSGSNATQSNATGQGSNQTESNGTDLGGSNVTSSEQP